MWKSEVLWHCCSCVLLFLSVINVLKLLSVNQFTAVLLHTHTFTWIFYVFIFYFLVVHLKFSIVYINHLQKNANFIMILMGSMYFIAISIYFVVFLLHLSNHRNLLYLLETRNELSVSSHFMLCNFEHASFLMVFFFPKSWDLV